MPFGAHPGTLHRCAVLAVTHDRWFAREFDRYLCFGEDGRVVQTDGPVWDAGRVVRSR
ncbi:MAG TPA: hypothetical protein VGR21_02060 [Cryptosporangiaceae bacterium]|nr:hypothetical protein [Cryptosporangiaceae bacterium]